MATHFNYLQVDLLHELNNRNCNKWHSNGTSQVLCQTTKVQRISILITFCNFCPLIIKCLLVCIKTFVSGLLQHLSAFLHLTSTCLLLVYTRSPSRALPSLAPLIIMRKITWNFRISIFPHPCLFYTRRGIVVLLQNPVKNFISTDTTDHFYFFFFFFLLFEAKFRTRLSGRAVLHCSRCAFMKSVEKILLHNQRTVIFIAIRIRVLREIVFVEITPNCIIIYNNYIVYN